MKIRQGFVSNSSSSSFIVVFDRKELTIDYLKETLYYDADRVPYCHNYGSDNESFSTDELCSSIISTLEFIGKGSGTDKEAVTEDALMEALQNLSEYDDPRMPVWPSYDRNISTEDRLCAYNKYEEECNIVRREIANEFIKDLDKSEYVFVGEFSDNDGSLYSHLEHDGTFNNVTHRVISNH